MSSVNILTIKKCRRFQRTYRNFESTCLYSPGPQGAGPVVQAVKVTWPEARKKDTVAPKDCSINFLLILSAVRSTDRGA